MRPQKHVSRAPPCRRNMPARELCSTIPHDRGDESFADDLNMGRGIVSGRVALLLRSTEIRPHRPNDLLPPFYALDPGWTQPLPSFQHLETFSNFQSGLAVANRESGLGVGTRRGESGVGTGSRDSPWRIGTRRGESGLGSPGCSDEPQRGRTIQHLEFSGLGAPARVGTPSGARIGSPGCSREPERRRTIQHLEFF